ncbi:hypothetical protein [Clostridium sp. LP20]|uniref:hypothetical protein n=1 Tax=Clostridium sp. LP20 TaxID=3418665 RepID=UPI003EE6720A
MGNKLRDNEKRSTVVKEKSIIQVDEKTVLLSLSDFNEPFTNYLEQLDLPVEGVLYPISERRKIINSLQEALEILSVDDRKKSMYLTRFTASIMAGLFDGAVTYLWNETVKSLRRMVIEFDVEYAFKIAENINNRYKGLKSADDLSCINEYDLITICNRMELITEHVFEVFKFINYMRNHSSSAHPNENNLGAYDLLSWLDNCIKYAIKAEPNQHSIKVKQFLYNLRTNDIPTDDVEIIGQALMELPQQMIDDLLWSLFGMYTDEKVINIVNDNIEKVVDYVWNASSEEKKYEIGEKYGYFRKNAIVSRKERADEFLNLVNGVNYKDEDSIAYEIRETLNSLKSAHFGTNNFYNEYPWAKMLENLIPQDGNIPSSVISEWVRIISLCYIGNGLGYRNGVDERAEGYYKDFITKFKDKEIRIFVELFDDTEMLSDTIEAKAKQRFFKLCELLKNQAKNPILVKALDYSIRFSSSPKKIYKSSEFSELMRSLK